ncbi:5-formyltetrahydrofolate cyclo-ligase [Deinococcus peraridilitoris]|uniref:5-formyltetrahydrofolate cyclo-ligase n=1 Tax=Deinococcus peraridilitoris (strain DSM 19664 / LMG 22246 / CIP 109416 / KR-200) TaxID=937777 RepID=L0A256_DEIPD|nr:5-formyltetrahydrofolate cyclo-ligase [Deinococcus peraridilitoris]AFZ67931.1 5-formyltetrahydrofolate cyclo-ligase [Deinococcus peraridilitoris DSM 19664]
MAELIKPGQLRDEIWGTLMRARAVGYPLPPHGHHPNFTGATDATRALLGHPTLGALRTLIVGPERVLYTLRKLALQQGKVLYVPDQRREGWYVRLEHQPKGAELKHMSKLGEPRLHPEDAQGVVLACVAVDQTGARLSKGFGWGAAGLKLGLPEFTLAHPLMLREELPCVADSRVELIATPGKVWSPLSTS